MQEAVNVHEERPDRKRVLTRLGPNKGYMCPKCKQSYTLGLTGIIKKDVLMERTPAKYIPIIVPRSCESYMSYQWGYNVSCALTKNTNKQERHTLKVPAPRFRTELEPAA
jgi:hypothetical protein